MVVVLTQTIRHLNSLNPFLYHAVYVTLTQRYIIHNNCIDSNKYDGESYSPKTQRVSVDAQTDVFTSEKVVKLPKFSGL